MPQGPNFSGNQPRPYNFVDGPADLNMLCQAAGLDPSATTKPEFLAQYGFPALMELFSDGELRFGTALHSQGPVDPYRHLSGTPEERHGDFYTKMAALREQANLQGGPLEDEMHRLERLCGVYLATLAARGEVTPQTEKNMVQPGVDPVTGRLYVNFGGHRWVSNRDTAVVLEYGPGLAGVKWLNTQLGGLTRGRLAFQYIAASNGPFVNQFLMDTYSHKLEQHFGPMGKQLARNGQLFIGREDGMQRATEELLATPQPGGTHEMTDLIVLTAVHRAGPAELERTISLSPQLLKRSGRLLLSAPLTEVAPGTTTFDQQLAWALQAGYHIEWQTTAGTGDSKLGTATTSGFACLRK